MLGKRYLNTELFEFDKDILTKPHVPTFIAEEGDNELLTLEIIHNYVELLDQYFGSVCELDIIYNYEKVCPNINFQGKQDRTFFEIELYSEE